MGAIQSTRGDPLVSDQLRQLCLTVEVKDHHDVRAEDLEHRPFVIVSHSAVGTGLWTSLRRIHWQKRRCRSSVWRRSPCRF